GNVFIVEVEKAVHASVIEVPKGGFVINPHYRSRGKGKPSAPDIAIYPSLNIIPKPPSQRRIQFRRTSPRTPDIAKSHEMQTDNLIGASNTIVYYEEWNFGTLDYYTGAPTACTGPGLLTQQIYIPVQEVFWNPPIIGGAPSTAGYVINVPVGVTAHNFVIDLYRIQQ
ncbi:1468_t:CDS:2, partial [Funneliformis caledonium]